MTVATSPLPDKLQLLSCANERHNETVRVDVRIVNDKLTASPNPLNVSPRECFVTNDGVLMLISVRECFVQEHLCTSLVMPKVCFPLTTNCDYFKHRLR